MAGRAEGPLHLDHPFERIDDIYRNTEETGRCSDGLGLLGLVLPIRLKFARRGNNLSGDFWAWMPIIGPSASGITIIHSADGLQYWRRS